MKVSVTYDVYSPSQYPWMGLNYFLILWLSSFMTRQFYLGRLFKNHKIISEEVVSRFRDLSEAKKRNCITYILEIFVTSLAFFAQIYGGKDILFKFKDDTDAHRYKWMTLSIELISLLYVWELVYREKIGWPLLLHHLCTIILIQLTVASFFDTGLPIYLRLALLLGFHATTEQTSFIALFLFRLNLYPKWQAFWFYLAACQSLVIKSSVNVAVFIYWVIIVKNGYFDTPDNKWHTFWEIFLLPSLLLLFFSQLYACKILFIIGRRCLSSNSSVARASLVLRRRSDITLTAFDTILDDPDILMACDSSLEPSDCGSGDDTFVINDTTV